MLLSRRFQADGKAAIKLNATQMNALFHFLKKYKNGDYEFEKYDCDCGESYDVLEELAQKDRYGINVETKICPKCGLVMTNPRMIQRSYNEFYDTLYRTIYVGQKRASSTYWDVQRVRGEKILEYLCKNMSLQHCKSMLEIGCSAGGIVSVFKDYGINRCKGIDLGSEYLKYGIDKGLELENCDAKRLAERGEKYDLIVLNHVFEHFLDIEKEMIYIERLLSKDGFLYVSVPGILKLEEVYQGDLLKYLQNAHIRSFCLNTLNNTLARYSFENIIGDESVQGVYKINYKKCSMKVNNSFNEIIDYLKNKEEHFQDNIIDLSDNRDVNIEVLNRLLKIKRNKYNVSDFFETKKIKNIAIYGAGILGQNLIEELDNSNIKVIYMIDNSKHNNLSSNVIIYDLSHDWEKVDAIVIAVGGDILSISELIEKKMKGSPIYTFLDILEFFENDNCGRK